MNLLGISTILLISVQIILSDNRKRYLNYPRISDKDYKNELEKYVGDKVIEKCGRTILRITNVAQESFTHLVQEYVRNGKWIKGQSRGEEYLKNVCYCALSNSVIYDNVTKTYDVYRSRAFRNASDNRINEQMVLCQKDANSQMPTSGMDDVEKVRCVYEAWCIMRNYVYNRMMSSNYSFRFPGLKPIDDQSNKTEESSDTFITIWHKNRGNRVLIRTEDYNNELGKYVGHKTLDECKSVVERKGYKNEFFTELIREYVHNDGRINQDTDKEFELEDYCYCAFYGSDIHDNITKTFDVYRSSAFRNSSDNDINEQMVECQKRANSQQKKPRTGDVDKVRCVYEAWCIMRNYMYNRLKSSNSSYNFSGFHTGKQSNKTPSKTSNETLETSNKAGISSDTFNRKWQQIRKGIHISDEEYNQELGKYTNRKHLDECKRLVENNEHGGIFTDLIRRYVRYDGKLGANTFWDLLLEDACYCAFYSSDIRDNVTRTYDVYRSPAFRNSSNNHYNEEMIECQNKANSKETRDGGDEEKAEKRRCIYEVYCIMRNYHYNKHNTKMPKV